MRLLYLFHTLRHLTLRQLVYRVIRAVQRRLSRVERRAPSFASSRRPEGTRSLSLRPFPGTDNYITNNEIVLLGSSYPIASPDAVDYSASERDALYRYLLSGQSFLLGEKSSPEAVRRALLAAARGILWWGPAGNASGRNRLGRPLMEPHPLSLRLITWVRVLAEPDRGPGHGPAGATLSFQDEELALLGRAIRFQLRALLRRIEYETDGNHLIDNAVGLMYAGAYLPARRAFHRGWELLRRELPKQLTEEGAHVEGSGVYHALILERVLDVINLLGCEEIRRFLRPAQAVTALRRRARAMLSWALHTRWGEEELLPVNDSLPGLAPGVGALEAYARELGVVAPESSSRWAPRPGTGPAPRARGAATATAAAGRQSTPARRRTAGRPGYQFYRDDRLELFFDAALIGAEHVPGHAHSDSLQLLLRLDGRDVLIDTGTSVYEGGVTRRRERSTGAHNTVVYGGREQSEVWSSFRVARRARPRVLGPGAFQGPGEQRSPEREEPWTWLFGAEHDGYRRYGVVHRRGLWVAASAAAGGGEDHTRPASGPRGSQASRGRAAGGPATSGTSGVGSAEDAESARDLAPARDIYAPRRSGILIRDELTGSASPGSQPSARKAVWGVAYFILAPALAREIGSLEPGRVVPSNETPEPVKSNSGPVTSGPEAVISSPGAESPVVPSQTGWQLSAGPVTFTFRSGPGAPTSETYALPRPRLERWLVAAGYRKQVETVRIAVPFFTLLETRIDER